MNDLPALQTVIRRVSDQVVLEDVQAVHQTQLEVILVPNRQGAKRTRLDCKASWTAVSPS